MEGQDYGKCINAQDQFVTTPQTSEIVKIFRRPSDGQFYWMDYLRNVFPFLGGGSCDIQKQVITVDSVNGDDVAAAADKYSWCLSFQTLGAAKLASVSGDLIYVFPGNYSIVEKLSKPGVDYYFLQGAIVEHNNTWVLDDSDDVAQNTKILGYGTFNQPFPGGGLGFSNITIPGTNFVIEFDSVIGNAGANFAGVTGSYNIKGKYARNDFQYITVGFNDCVWDFNVSKIDNVCATTGATFVFALLAETVPGETLVSKFKCNSIRNNANGSFGTVTIFNSSINHKVVVNADILHRQAAPTFLSSVLQITRGGAIEYSGHSNTDVGMAVIFGDFNEPVPNSILVNNSICNQVASVANRPTFSVNNQYHWITIKDSIVVSDTDDVCVVGAGAVFGDTEYGNLEISNSVIRNIKSNPATPTSAIKTDRIVGLLLLDDVILENPNANPASYSITTAGLNLPQSVSVLSGQVTADKVAEPVNIINNIVGTAIIVAAQALTNPLIK